MELENPLVVPTFWVFTILVLTLFGLGYYLGRSTWPIVIVRLIVYLLLGYVGYRASRNLSGQTVAHFYLIYFINLIANFTWDILIFNQKNYRNAIYLNIGLLISTSFLIYTARVQDPTISWILVPYLIYLIITLIVLLVAT